MHEQARYDRDDYIEIDFDNIKDEYKNQFDYRNYEQLKSNNFRYDYGSIMHYDPQTFAKDPTKKVMWAKQPHCNGADDRNACEQERQVGTFNSLHISQRK